MESRRSFLKQSGGLAALLSIGSLSGCMGGGLLGGDGGDGGDGSSSYRNWLYDPSVVMDAKNRMFMTMSIRSLYDNQGAIPQEFFTEMEEANSETDAVDVQELNHVSGIGYAQLQQAMSGSGETPGGGTFVVDGSFDVQTVVDNLDEDTETEYTEVDEYDGYRMFEMQEVNPDGSTQQEASGGLGISESNLVLGVTTGTNAKSGVAAAKASIDASNGDVDRYHQASDTGKTLMDMLGEPTMGMGAEVDPALMQVATMAIEDQRARQFVEGLIAGAFGGTIDGETTEGKMVALYDSETEPPTDTAQALLDVAQSAEPEAFEDINDISIEQDGDALVMTWTMDTAALWEDYGQDGGTARIQQGVPVDAGQLP